jgi:tRNA(Ile2) C34 agmatinyltransferase TiaS
MEKVVTLFNMGDDPDDVEIRHKLHIYAKGRHMATVSGVHDYIQREKNYPDHFTDIVVDRYGDKDKKRDVIITLVHKKALTIEEIELTRPVCQKCGERTELVDGCVFFYIYKCPKCGEEIEK